MLKLIKKPSMYEYANGLTDISMKTAIFTIMIGQSPMYKAALIGMQHYAKKTQSELIVSTEQKYNIILNNPRFEAHPAWAEKLQIQDLLLKYDRVLYLDADILINPNSPNIFDYYSNLDVNYLFNEGIIKNRSSAQKLIENKLGEISLPCIKKTDLL